MRFISILLLSAFLVSMAIAGYIEATVPHPTPGECSGCWVEHGFGTKQNLDDYGLIIIPVASGLVFFAILTYTIVPKSSVEASSQ
jgi:hypothetical protein